MSRYSIREAADRLDDCPTAMIVDKYQQWYFEIAFLDTVYGCQMFNRGGRVIPPHTPKKIVFKILRDMQ